tara:strand:- start:159 stop:779 length:621 start_codon:yes stop_codon:yes gene_type:complete
MPKFINIAIVSYIICVYFFPASAEEEVKDCKYCIQYEKFMDWPVESRPSMFVYQEDIKYPKGMFGDESKMKRAGEKVGFRFVKKKSSLGKKPGPMIMDMAYFEVLFNEMLNIPTTEVEKVEKLLKVRSAFRQSLKISPTASAEEAILKFYSLGKMMRSAKKKKQKVDKDLLIRKEALEQLKGKIAATKKAIKVSETAKKVEEVKTE